MGTNSTGTNQIGSSYVAILEGTDSLGIPNSFKCDYHVSTGKINGNSGHEISSYYELLHPCVSNVTDAMDVIERRLLTQLGQTFQLLPDGKACTIPDTSLNVWVIGLSSLPLDVSIDNMACNKLRSSRSSCCTVVHAPMTFWVTDANFQNNNIMGYLAQAIDGTSITAGTDYRTAYLGSQIESTAVQGQNQTRPIFSVPPNPVGVQQKQQQTNVSLVGGVVVAGFVAGMMAVVFVLMKRKRRFRKHFPIEDDIRTSLEHFPDSDQSEASPTGGDIMDIDHLQSNDGWTDEENFNQSYTFDLAASMKHTVMGTYGPTSFAVQPPHPMDDASDSEADSWAQTDATVGSLEERLEEITAEI
jgi:hypothetical protein